MNDMYVGQSPMERGEDEIHDDPLVVENNRLTDRIAELTTEVADLTAKLGFANAMNTYQDKTVSELTAEVAIAEGKLHSAMEEVRIAMVVNIGLAGHTNDKFKSLLDDLAEIIARNKPKDGA
jgi:polyhydroxyalkanoate synthesis regulator phasin